MMMSTKNRRFETRRFAFKKDYSGLQIEPYCDPLVNDLWNLANSGLDMLETVSN